VIPGLVMVAVIRSVEDQVGGCLIRILWGTLAELGRSSSCPDLWTDLVQLYEVTLLQVCRDVLWR
jgi:hypothetical protein